MEKKVYFVSFLLFYSLVLLKLSFFITLKYFLWRKKREIIFLKKRIVDLKLFFFLIGVKCTTQRSRLFLKMTTIIFSIIIILYWFYIGIEKRCYFLLKNKINLQMMFF